MYCKPLEAGLASEGRAVARTLGKMFDAMDNVSSWIVNGTITEDIQNARRRIRDQLEAEGWTVSYQNGQLQGTNHCNVYPPGSPAGARIRAQEFHGCSCGWNEGEANARLIAAAPDLLAACQAVRAFMFNEEKCSPEVFDAFRAIGMQLDTAIAKAEGLTP